MDTAKLHLSKLSIPQIRGLLVICICFILAIIIFFEFGHHTEKHVTLPPLLPHINIPPPRPPHNPVHKARDDGNIHNILNSTLGVSIFEIPRMSFSDHFTV